MRRAIQRSQESLRALAKRYGVNQKTVAKWKKRSSVSDGRTGLKDPHSTVLTIEEEAIVVAADLGVKGNGRRRRLSSFSAAAVELS